MDKQLEREKNQAIQLNTEQGVVATAEQSLEGHEANKAIDGQSDTYWAGGLYYISWELDLGSRYELDRIQLCTGSGPDEYTHYIVQCSVDRLNWQTVAEKRDHRCSAEGEQFEIGDTAKYIRITFTYCSSGETVKLRDVKIFGCKAALQSEAEVDERRSPKAFYAVNIDDARGFEVMDVEDSEPGGPVGQVLSGGEVGSYVIYRKVDFTADGVNQLRGMFGFSDMDREKRIKLEVRLDGPDGVCLGTVELFRQWKRWSNLAGDLQHDGQAERLSGVYDVCLIVSEAAEGQSLLIHWLAFVQGTPLPVPRTRPADLPEPAGEYQIYYGNLHSHTALSDGIGVPEEAYDFARYTAGIDFLAITEHSNLYDHDLDWKLSRKWRDIQEMAEQKTEEGKFLALFGAETTWYNQFGHMNTYAMDCFINTYETRYNDVNCYYETIKQYPESIHQWNHPWSCGVRHHDEFEPYDEAVDQVLHMIELNPMESPDMGGLFYYIRALDKGWHVAPVGSQDNHQGQWGSQNTLRTAILVERLTREHFYDAARRQRVYFTSALHLQVWFRINGEIMGSRLKGGEELNVAVKASYGQATGRRIVKAELYGEQGRVLEQIELDAAELNWNLTLPAQEEQRYYFVKVYQDDGEFAVTAPIWILNAE